MSDSSDSDEENVIEPTFSRKISTNKRLNSTAGCIKEGYLSLQRSQSFQKWRRRYFWLKGKTLFYGRDKQAEIFEEIELSEASVAEYTAKNVNHAFQLIATFRNFVLATDSRKELESWIQAISHAAKQKYYDPNDQQSMMSGMHSWYITSHARPMHCNVCSETLTGVTSHGLSCGVCRFKAHKRCATKAPNNCKWSTLATVGQHIIEEEDGSIAMEHQWLEGNLPVSAHCSVCEKSCGSVRRLQDARCLWCRAMVHTSCKDSMSRKCPISLCRVSVIPPMSIHSIDSDGFCEASRVPGTSPLLVFVNSKSGDNGGVKFLRRFKQLLNPAQVFDLMNGGPFPGLRLFQSYDQFRILICGGDGSVSWVLSELDSLGLHNRCQVGVLPLGTGNDLARVLGWGSVMTDDNQLQSTIEKFEQSQIKMLDRWSVMVYDRRDGLLDPPSRTASTASTDAVHKYESSVTDHLSKILNSSDHSTVISSARVLCQTVKDFVAEVDLSEPDSEKQHSSQESLSSKCQILQVKLNSLMEALDKVSELGHKVHHTETVERESHKVTAPITVHCSETAQNISEDNSNTEQDIPTSSNESQKKTKFVPKDLLMSRANSLKKAVRQIIKHTEDAVDTQNAESKEVCRLLSTISSASSDSQTDSLNRPCVTFDVGSERARSPTSIDSFPQQPSTIPASQQSPTRKISSLSTMASASSTENESMKTGSSQAVNPDKVPVNKLRVGNAIANNLGGGGGFIGKMLLANADTICAAVTPQFDDQYTLSLYNEKCVMNNYFGIGIDAKIMMEFLQQRDEHPERFRSRARNLMTFVGLGGREMISQTFKHFKQRIQLECDGHRLPLPDLQGIVILNIPSYSGGTNFWGSRRHNSNEPFIPPSFDDKIVEVMAVYSSAHIGMSRIVNLQYHRIAQCRTVKVTILGDEPVPVQVDGEAWMQAPGMIRIQHKNRAQMLTRDRDFEHTLRSWSERQKEVKNCNPAVERRVVNDASSMKNLVDSTRQLIDCLTTMNLPALAPTEAALGKIGEFVTLDDATQIGLTELSVCSKELCTEVQDMLSKHSADLQVHKESQILKSALLRTQEQLNRYTNIKTRSEESHRSRQGPFKLIGKLKGRKKSHSTNTHVTPSQGDRITMWDTESVANWLSNLGLGEYAEVFVKNDIRGPELLQLQRTDLRDLGVSKVGHLKRIQSALKSLQLSQETR